ncbi:MAG: SdpI family protein [Candidatus Promineifilaceae bacterium]
MNDKPLQLRGMYIFSAVTLIILFLLSFYAWGQLPADAQIPVHFDASGEPDRYGGKLEGLFLLPAIVSLTVLLLACVPQIQPRKSNLIDSQKAYKAIWGSVLVLFIVVHATVIAAVLGTPINIVPVVPVAVGALFVVLGNYMGKTRSNWVMGIRTPWTLESELAWDKTHRLGGKLFVVLGLLFMVSAIVITGELWAYLIVVGSLGITAFLTVYSYMVWKTDPNVQSK